VKLLDTGSQVSALQRRLGNIGGQDWAAEPTLTNESYTGLFFGLASGLVFLLVRRWLPAGWVGGLAYGVPLLVVAGTRLEPLRRDNLELRPARPGGLSVAAFAALVMFHGSLVAALAGRLSGAVPLPVASPGAIATHAPLLLLEVLVPLRLLAVIVGAVVVGASRIPQMVAALQTGRLAVVGRAALAIAGLVLVPGFASAVVDIVGRG